MQNRKSILYRVSTPCFHMNIISGLFNSDNLTLRKNKSYIVIHNTYRYMFPHAFWFTSGSYFLWRYNLIWLHSAVRTNVKVLDQHMYKIEKNKRIKTKLTTPNY